MRIRTLSIDGFRNLTNCNVEFSQEYFLNTLIGRNGSGKSNLIEAILEILIGLYFRKPPQFLFRLEYHARQNEVVLERSVRGCQVSVNGARWPIDQFAEALRIGPMEFFPDLTLIYYSGECRRVQQLVTRYRRHFQKLTREPNADALQPLFVQTSNELANTILLALFAHGKRRLLELLRIQEVVQVTFELRSPEDFNPKRDEPKLWNTVGAIRRIVAAIDEVAEHSQTRRPAKAESLASSKEGPYLEYRKYYFRDDTNSDNSVVALAQRLKKSGDNLYSALKQLNDRGLLRKVQFLLLPRDSRQVFEFSRLSEGEKQLIAVVGSMELAHRQSNLILLDEPNTHLNPQWSWEYPQLLLESISGSQTNDSTVLMTTHDPVVISGLMREQVLLAHLPSVGNDPFTRPVRHPRGQGVANLLCSSEYFGLPSSLDKETQKLLDERLVLSMKRELSEGDRSRLGELNVALEVVGPGVSERDPDYAEFLRQRYNRRIQ